ncbi:tail fiber protein [Chryseobacterium sp.]|uniref:tail fiber protein n=1 Tax=Chryseobacterium sp. TaxID=1871047 RepID=UPI0025C31C55|nr:tail fiber protein [Chryseobacterium sp.]MBV8328833.1 hypothetical protein [Chryseobacterium sp.]
MAKKTGTELKGYFKAGKRPTEIQFGDLIDSYVHLDNPEIFPANYKHKDFSIRFPHLQANMAVDILFGNNRVNGNMEIQIVGAYNNENTVGIIRKQIIMGANTDNGIWNAPVSRIIEASGPIVNHIYIGDVVWDSALTQYKLTIYHTRSTGNTYGIRVVQHSNTTVFLEKASVSDIYVNPLSGQTKHFVNYNDSLGIGTPLPETSLHVKAPKNQGHSNVVGGLFDRSEAAGGSNIVQLKYHSTADLELNSFYTGTNFRYGSYGDFNLVNNISGGVHGGINLVTDAQTRLKVHPTGNVGIGIDYIKESKLTVYDGREAGTSNFQLRTNHLRNPDRYFMKNVINGTGTEDVTFSLRHDGQMYVSGNVGIGTQNPDQKLTVKGKIHAEDVIVDTNVPADYVFQKYFDGQSEIRPDYQMPTIHELEDFVRENKHLPELPSAKEMSQDGVNLGEMQMKMLQKIEELTLYIISLKKEMDSKLN